MSADVIPLRRRDEERPVRPEWTGSVGRRRFKDRVSSGRSEAADGASGESGGESTPAVPEGSGDGSVLEKTQVMKRRRLPALPSGVGAATLAVPKRCACCFGRGVKAGGDALGAWWSEPGKRVDHAKKTLWWVVGGWVVCYLTAPFGIITLAAVGTVAAFVAGRKKPSSDQSSGGTSDAAGGGSVGSPATEPVSSPQEGDSSGVGAVSAQVRRESGAGGRVVPVGPPSTSPLVGRVDPVDVWSDPVRWGLDRFGAPVETILPGNPGLLTGGVSGSGKSVASHQMLCHVALDPHAQLWLVDGKAVELIHYKDIAHAYIDEPDLDAFAGLIDELDAEMRRRKKTIAGRSVKVTGRNWRSYDAPFILLHIDEIQLFTLQGREGQKLAQRLAMVASQCRAFGIAVSVATQRPEDSVVPPLLCNNLVLKLALRTEDASQSNTILGNGMAGRGYRSDWFTADQKGATYYRGEVGDPFALTTGYLQIPDEDEGGPDHVRDIVKVATELRREAGTLPESVEDADEGSETELLAVVEAAIMAMDAARVDRMSRVGLADAMGWGDDDALRDALTAAGVCSPHPMDGVSGRGWYRRDLDAVMK